MKAFRTTLVGILALGVVVLAVLLLRGPDDTSTAAAPKGSEPAPGRVAEEPALQPPQAPELQAPERSSPAGRTEVPDRLGDLTVRVLDAANERPLPGVPVALHVEGDAEQLEQASGDDGRCRFEALEPGAYTLSTQADGDLDYVCDPLELELAEGARPEVELRVERRWFLAGVVVERGREDPVAGVGLMAVDAQGKGSSMATSDDAGRFRSRKSLAAGPLGIHLAQGWMQGLTRTNEEGPELVRVEVGQQDVSQLVVEVDWFGVLSGVVLDEREQPIEGASVRVLAADSIYLDNPRLRFWRMSKVLTDMGGRTDESDAEGRFSVDRLPNDRALVVTASAPGFAFARSADLEPPFRPGAEAVIVRLAAGGAITGTVLDAGGGPLEHALVSALSQDVEYQPDPSMTDEQGVYRIESVEPGPTEVTAQVRGERGLYHAVASGTVEVLAGQEVALVLQAGADGVRITGIAVDQDGQRITADRQRLTVRATPLDPQPGEPTWGHDTPVADDGTFDVTVARPATYRIGLLSGAAGDLWETQDVTAPAQDVRLTFTIRPSCLLTVRAIDAQTGEPIPMGSYTLSSGSGSYGGYFAGGRVVATVQQGLYTASIRARGYASASQELDLSGPLQPEMSFELRLDRGRPVSGRVVDGAGAPVKGCSVVLFTGSHLDLENATHTDAEGRFTIASAPASGGQVWVIDESYRALATAEVGAGEVLLTVENP